MSVKNSDCPLIPYTTQMLNNYWTDDSNTGIPVPDLVSMIIDKKVDKKVSLRKDYQKSYHRTNINNLKLAEHMKLSNTKFEIPKNTNDTLIF